MLGFNLNHVSKRGHWSQEALVINSGEVSDPGTQDSNLCDLIRRVLLLSWSHHIDQERLHADATAILCVTFAYLNTFKQTKINNSYLANDKMFLDNWVRWIPIY